MTMMSKKYQILVFVLVASVLGSKAQPNTVYKKEAPHLVDMNNGSATRRQLGVASGLSDARRGKETQSSLSTANKISRVERSNSGTQLTPDNILGPAHSGQTSGPTSPTPKTSTDFPSDCRPRKSLDQASKSTMLTDADLSVAMEMCMGINEELFTKLWSNMNFMKLRNDSAVAGPNPVPKDDHAKDQHPRKVSIKTLTVSHEKLGTACTLLVSDFMETGMYQILNSAHGASMYLVAQKKWGVVHLTRLVLNSSLEDMTTVLLATSKHWRISASSRTVSHIKGQHEVIISLEDVTVTLVRSVIRERVFYDITVQLKTRRDVAYGGLLGDLLMAKSASLATKANSKPKSQQKCKPTTAQKQTMAKHKASFCTFMDYLLDLLEDLAHNLPSTQFE